MQNSKPAKPSKKNEVDNKLMSSFKEPRKTDKTYKIIHTSSEYNNNVNKLLEFKKNKKNENQKNVFKYINQLCIKNYL